MAYGVFSQRNKPTISIDGIQNAIEYSATNDLESDVAANKLRQLFYVRTRHDLTAQPCKGDIVENAQKRILEGEGQDAVACSSMQDEGGIEADVVV